MRLEFRGGYQPLHAGRQGQGQGQGQPSGGALAWPVTWRGAQEGRSHG